MKSKFGLSLPWGIYISISVLFIFSISIWHKADFEDDKILIALLFLIFALSTIQAAILIRRDKFETYKNILNAIWNIETAIVFLYGIYVIIELSYLPEDNQPSFTKWGFENAGIFTLIITVLGTVCVARAGYSVAEVFKEPIKRIANANKNADENKKNQIKPKVPQPHKRNRRRNRG